MQSIFHPGRIRVWVFLAFENVKKNGKLRERRSDGSGPPSKTYRTIINPKMYIPADSIGPGRRTKWAALSI